ncbi:hypothetical protein FHW96_001057 [Novosphingobium sp. SG751A]|nr:hypothetical protein [Novosphingobium sp. SG751A]
MHENDNNESGQPVIVITFFGPIGSQPKFGLRKTR